MKRILILLIVLMLAVSPVAHGEGDVARIIAELDLIDDAMPLLSVLANASYDLSMDLSGAPDPALAWLALDRYIGEHAGYRAGPFTADEMQGFYNKLFAEGKFSDIEASDCAPMERMEGGYGHVFGDGDPVELAVENAYRVEDDGRYTVDLSVYTDSNGAGQWFCYNAVAELVPDSAGGAQVLSLQRSQTPLPTLTDAVATAELADHPAVLAIDGNLHTCWAYDAAVTGASVALRFDGPVAVRGLVIAAGCMKSEQMFEENGRPAVVSIRMSNGATRAFDLRDVGLGFECMIVLPFGEVETVTEIVVNVDEVEEGAGSAVYISEIGVF